jgi:hypothetical protein
MVDHAQGAMDTKSRCLSSLHCTFALPCSTRKIILPLQIGNMDHSLDIFGCQGDLLAKLSDKTKCDLSFVFSFTPRSYEIYNRVSATQAVTCSHPSVVERVASGNGSGRCVLWAPADIDEKEE